MKDRPRLKAPLHSSDKVVEILGWACLLFLWMWTLVYYGSLPDIIPTHYNAAGEADAFGDKRHILGLPVVATLLFVGMSILNQYPHIFNYPNEINAENALHQYTQATRMMRYLKLAIVITFGAIVVQTTRHAMQSASDLGGWFLPIVLLLFLGPTFYFLIKMSSSKNKGEKVNSDNP